MVEAEAIGPIVLKLRLLGLTIQIEKVKSGAAEITIDSIKELTAQKKGAAAQIANQVIYGNYTSICNSGADASFTLNINNEDVRSVARALQDAGISESDANEIAAIYSAETPEGAQEPFGGKAKLWIAKNIGKAADGTWKIGIAAATRVLTEAALKYYGLK